MIPSNNIAHIYVKIIGENSLLSMAQSNLLSHLDKIRKVRTHTFISNNGQTEFGISNNFGAERYFSWEDTIIDCRNNPTLMDSETLQNLEETISENLHFQRFKKDIEDRAEGLITVTPFYSSLSGVENMRYNIKRAAKIEDFDIIRVGIKLSAKNDRDFKQGLKNLYNHEHPFNVRKPLMHA